MVVYNTGNMWKKDSKSNGTIHQCDQRFGGLMIVRFNDHRPPSIPDGTLSYQKRGRCDIDEDNGDVVECKASRLSQTIVKIIVVL